MQKKITWTWQKIITAILGVLGIGTLTSCYGMPLNGEFIEFTGKVFYDHDNDSSTDPVPVSGIKVTGETTLPRTEPTMDYSLTGENGEFWFSFFKSYEDEARAAAPTPDYTITFTDIDGEDNGNLKDLTVKIDSNRIDPETLTLDLGKIQLDPK